MPKTMPIAAPAQNITIKATTQPKPQADHTPQPKGPEDVAQSPANQTAQATPSSAKPEVTPAEAKPNDPKLEVMAKKEIALRNLERDIKAREAAIETRVQDAVRKAVEAERSKFKSNPLDELEIDGITYDQLVEQAVNRPDPEIRKLNRKIQTLESTQENLSKQAQTAQQVAREQAVKQLHGQIEKLVEENPEFETVKATGKSKDVLDYMVKTFDETGELPDMTEATKKIENDLFEEAMKYTTLKKVQDKLKPSLADAVAAKTGQQPQQATATTLTNSMNSANLTPRERAILAFKGDLKR